MVILVMGVAGAGKTTVGGLLARKLDWTFRDADDLHSAANHQKMHRGLPLEDQDRQPWLAAVRDLIQSCIANSENAVVVCSALKRAYREEIINSHPEVKVVYLKGAPEFISERITHREGHFFNPSLLHNQFEVLEEPTDALIEDAAKPAEQIDESIVAQLNLRSISRRRIA